MDHNTHEQKSGLAPVSRDTAAISGEKLAYPNSPDPEISSYIMSIAPGAVTEWMTHPVPGFVYILEGALTVEFATDGARQTFKPGEAFLQAKTAWHRGRNDGDTPMRFLAVFCGAKDVANVVHPPKGIVI
jgi:quercetin dioxygenase-like cupin family protein